MSPLRLPLALLLLLGTASASAQEPPRAFLEVEAAPSPAYPGELVHLRARVGLREDVLAQALVPIVPRALDLPVVLRAPWLEGLPDAVLVPPAAEPDTTLVLGGSQGRARRTGVVTRDGARYAVFVVERDLRFQHAGRVALGVATLEYAVSGSQQRDPFGEHVAREVQRLTVSAAPAEVTVRPLPEEGRPPDYAGLVGDLVLTRSASPRDLTVGDSLTLVLTLAARDGSTLAGLPAPGLPELRGLSLLGMRELDADEGAPAGARAFAYSLAVADPTLRELPAIELTTFLPTEPAHYATLTAPALPILVRTPGDGITAPVESPPEDPESPSVPPLGALGLAALGTLLLLLLFAVLRRR